ALPRTALLTPPAGFDVSAVLPGGATIERAHVTVMMPGFVLDSKDLRSGTTSMTYRYDPVTLAQSFPNLDVNSGGRPIAADLITVTLFATGRQPSGTVIHAARVVALHADELLNLPVGQGGSRSLVAAVLPASRSVRVGTPATFFVT